MKQHYEANQVERAWYQRWHTAGVFRGQPEAGHEPYVIVIPPPNVTGVLTMGHVLNNTIQDILIRRARQEGKAAMWLPGTDHAGIATQTRVERELRKEGLTRHDLGRDRFLEKVWEWRQTHGDIIVTQLQRLGCSCDWDRLAFTMDPSYSQRVIRAFVELYRRGYIYRGQYMVNWCPVSLTALSDEEVIMKSQNGLLYHMRYELVDEPGHFLEIATTRPETLMGDTAVAVHPADPRYRHLIGRSIWRPFPREAIPIVGDEAIDPEFGSGVLKVTPAHDKLDFEIGQRHNLPFRDVLHPDGRLNDLAGPEFSGMDRFVARKAAAEKLREMGLLVKEVPYENNVGYSERADVPVEPRLSEQWFLKYPRVDEALQVVDSGLIRFYPERWTKVYQHWLHNIRDWCISRQLWWGHRIPVWYRKGLPRHLPENIHVSETPPLDPENWDQEEDVLDTWASSWLWPFATMGWGNKEEEKREGLEFFYPTTTLVTGPDIIFLWVARMIIAGLEFMRPGEAVERRIPFRNVYFTGIVRDLEGRKMSKSLGNSPDPIALMDEFGADGLRYGIMSIAPQGQDIRFGPERVEQGRFFCNKLWNACRFRTLSGSTDHATSLEAILEQINPERVEDEDVHILLGLSEVLRAVSSDLANFEFNQALQKIYGFFWTDFCDWYVEVSKVRLAGVDAGTGLAVQDLCIRCLLQLLHPFMPFITEELWHLMGYGPETEFIGLVPLPDPNELLSRLKTRGVSLPESTSVVMRRCQELVSAARALKAEYRMASRRDVKLYLSATNEDWKRIQSLVDKLCRLAGADSLERVESREASPAKVTTLGTLYLDVAASMDLSAEKTRLEKELAATRQHLVATQKRLSNDSFRAKAPPQVIAGAEKQRAELQEKCQELERLLGSLS